MPSKTVIARGKAPKQSREQKSKWEIATPSARNDMGIWQCQDRKGEKMERIFSFFLPLLRVLGWFQEEEMGEIHHPITARVLHWCWAIAMFLLLLTGLYLHSPSWMPFFHDLSYVWPMHLICGLVVIALVGLRVVYSIYSGDHKDLIMRVEHILDLIPVIKYYTFKIKWEPQQGKYNAGQRLVYTLIWPSLLGLQIVSGIILYLLPGVAWVRGVHFIVMWLLIITVVAHIYLGVIHGWTLIKSMITGKLEESEHKTEVEA